MFCEDILILKHFEEPQSQKKSGFAIAISHDRMLYLASTATKSSKHTPAGVYVKPKVDVRFLGLGSF